jgi:flavin reductase (DIM6/NTAB) family NADH-FMN oxidoreductase RutF
MSVFTFNQVHEGISAKAHYTSAKLEKNESEFEHCRLREKNLDGFGAPFVFESHVKLAVRHVNTYHQVDQLASYTYARPGIFPTNLVQPSEIHIKSSHT